MRPLKTYRIIHRRKRGYPGGGKGQQSLSPWLIPILGLLVLAVSISLIWIGQAYSYYTGNLPSIKKIDTWLNPQNGQMLSPTRFYDRTGQVLLGSLETPGIERKFLSVDPSHPEHFSPQLTRAAVAMLQPGFWSSNGISTENLLDPEPATIAEKLVSALLLENEPPGIKKTIRMRLLAAQITKRYGASQVLEWYLNSADFGHLAYGAEGAAQLYFGKSASNLDLMESALLVAISESPALNPIDAPAHIEELQKTALNRLLLASVIGSSEYIHLAENKPGFLQNQAAEQQDTSAFINMTTEQLESKIGRQRVERGGLKVITTLNTNLQSQLVCTLKAQAGRVSQPSMQDTLSDCEAGRLLPSFVNAQNAQHAGLRADGVITDPQTGEVLAMAGELGQAGSIGSLMGHEPGSLLTPFVAAAAFARGYSPGSLVWDVPDPDDRQEGSAANPAGTYHGPVSLRTAIANDLLAPLTKIFDEIGGQTLQQTWAPFGLGKVTQGVPESSILSRGGMITALQAAQAYGVLAANGTLQGVENNQGNIDPMTIRSVEDTNGSVISTLPEKKSVAILSESLAYLVNHILSDESARELSMGSSNPLEIGRPSGGKAGQILGENSLWSVSYTPQLVIAAWLGQDSSPQNTPLDLKMATGISHALLQYASLGLPVQGWEEPAGITQVKVCDPSGYLPTDVCPSIVNEVFLEGNEPTSTDTLFQKITVNRETGRLATVFTPPELLEEKIFMIVPAMYREWAKRAGIPMPPTEYDTIQISNENPDVQITSPAGFAYVRGKTEILGSAKAENFYQYRLEVGQGLNPEEWIQIGQSSSPVVNGVLGEWDTSGKDGLYAMRLIVIDQNQEYDSAVIQVTVDNTPPDVRIAYPKEGETLPASSAPIVTFRTEANDSVGISRVEWWLDGTRIGTREQEPFILSWTAAPGDHTLIARAFDLAGNLGESEPVKFTVTE